MGIGKTFRFYSKYSGKSRKPFYCKHKYTQAIATLINDFNFLP